MSLRDDFQPKWKLFLKWGWLSFAVFILMAPVFYTMYISFNELGFGAKYYVFTFQWYENVFSDKQLINALGWTMLLALITLPIVIPFGLLSAKLYKQSTKKVWIVFVLLSPLFVPADILGSALLVFFKNELCRKFDNVYPYFIQGEVYPGSYYESIFSGLPKGFVNEV